MELIYIFFTLIFIDYLIFIGLLIYGFAKIKTVQTQNLKPVTSFSIIVPFRNEEKHLPKLLDSISELNYPIDLFEIIVVDDFSEDKSESLFYKWRMENGLIENTLLENLRLTNSPKKDALLRAIPVAKNEWIITTDADCKVQKNWLLAFDNYIQNNEVEMLAGAVRLPKSWNPFVFFQQIDLFSLQGTTIGSFGLYEAFMCNGANFAYKKSFFEKIGGFGKSMKIASGDDVFLLQNAVSKFPDKVHYLKNKESIVETKAENSIVSLFNQRIRWAAKSTEYKSDFSKALAIIVLLANFSLIVGLILVYYNFIDWKFIAILFASKFLFDFVLLLKTNLFLGRFKLIFPFISSLIYPFFSTFVGVYALVGSFDWKGRKHTK